MPKLVIDEMEIEVPKGTKVIAAAEKLGIVIPRFCYHEALGSVGACRMCAVKFVQGPFKGVQMSCMIDAQDGMVVSTTDEEAVAFRKQVIEWLMMNHPHDCPVCDEGGQCLLQDETVSGGHGIRRYPGPKRTYRDQYLGPFVQHEMNRCIHCYRCSRFYQGFAGYRDLGAMQIANRVYFGRFKDGQLESPFHGNLVDLCPVGVYTDKTARFQLRRWDLERSSSLCLQCSLGCNTIANARYRALMRVEGRFNKEVNGYFICDRGRFGFSYTNGGADHRQRPWWARVDSDEVPFGQAMGAASQKIQQIVEAHGRNALACVGSSRSSLETQTLLKRFCKAGDFPEPVYFLDPSRARKTKASVSRLENDLAVSLREIEGADFILAVGVDPIHEAPMLALAMRQANRNGAPVALIDPRPVTLPLDFDHIPVAPSKIADCLGSLIKGALDEKDLATLGEEARAYYGNLPAPAVDGRWTDLIGELAQKLRAARNPVIVCGTDVVREGTPELSADHALALRKVKGAGGLFYVLPGANSFSGALLGSSERPSLAEVLEGIENDTVKALIVVETDPFGCFPDRARLEEAALKLELLMVLDYLPTETVRRAHLFLPVTTHYETGSSFINQEGRIQFAEPATMTGTPLYGEHPPRVHRDHVPGGEARAAWFVLAELARALPLPEHEIAVPVGTVLEVRRTLEPIPRTETFRPGKDFPSDFLLSFVAEEMPAMGELPGEYPLDGLRVRLAKGGKGLFSPAVSHESKTLPPQSFEIVLTDRLYGTEELSSYADTLQPVVEDPCLFVHPKDASQWGVSEGDILSLLMDGGSLDVPVRLKENMAPGVMVLPRHRRLAWQKIKSSPVLLPPDRIRKKDAS
jgi:NADH-quinone oxidoreductase subunit G